jgi:hypothetical protein
VAAASRRQFITSSSSCALIYWRLGFFLTRKKKFCFVCLSIMINIIIMCIFSNFKFSVDIDHVVDIVRHGKGCRFRECRIRTQERGHTQGAKSIFKLHEMSANPWKPRVSRKFARVKRPSLEILIGILKILASWISMKINSQLEWEQPQMTGQKSSFFYILNSFLHKHRQSVIILSPPTNFVWQTYEHRE